MSTRTILIDIDNTLFDTEEAVRQFIFYEWGIVLEPRDHLNYWGVVNKIQIKRGFRTPEDAAKILFQTSVVRNAKPFPGTRLGMDLLGKMPFGRKPARILFPTGRPETQKSATISQISTHFPQIKPWQIIMEGYKQRLINERGMIVLIDDNPFLMGDYGLDDYSNLLRIIPNQPYNQEISAWNLVRVGNPRKFTTWAIQVPYLVWSFIR